MNNLEIPSDGFIKGNLFKNLYVPYKNYQPYRLVPNNDQAKLLLTVSELGFAVHELRLFLDIYPYDQEMLNTFNELERMSNDAVLTYENKYGPLMENALSNPQMFSWEKTVWPWEMED